MTIDPGLNPGRRDGKPETNRLSYGAAFFLAYSSSTLKMEAGCSSSVLDCAVSHVFMRRKFSYSCSWRDYVKALKDVGEFEVAASEK
jgi:hypothetical protein